MMKHPKIFFILYILVMTWDTGFAQQDDSYDSLWIKVNQYEKEALTRSALEAVDTISAKAKKEGNSTQTVKALLYKSKYALTLEEDAQLNIVNEFKSAISTSEFPTKNVLESYLANLYWQYFQQHRYQFYDRTQAATKVDSTDFRTWDLATLFQEIDTRFEASLSNQEGLQKENQENFEPILDKQPGSEDYRPTLFDLLAHEALKFYKTDENSITRPANQFEIDESEILCDAYSFAQIDINTEDETALQAKALRIYQDLIAFHFSDADPKALVEVDIERLDFIHNNAVFANKDERFLEVLRNSAENLAQSPLSALYTYEIARVLNQQGDVYRPKTDVVNRWKRKEALALCDGVIAQFPNRRGAEKCMSLKSRIYAPSIQLTTEKFLPVDVDSRLLVNYKNIETLQLSAFKISQSELIELNRLYRQDKQLAFLQKLPVVKKWETDLKNEQDYQQHGIEILLPALDNGQYVILATPATENDGEKTGGMNQNERKGKKNTGSFAFSPLKVTDLAVVSTRTPESYHFQVIDRHDGNPISGATVELSYLKNYDGDRLGKTLKTDAYGGVKIPLSDENWSDVRMTVIQKDEKADFGPYYVSRRYDRKERSKVTTAAFLFTDRSIYRPGQPLYFKGIVVEKFENKSSVAPDENLFVTLHDANGQEVSQQDFATNQFGSVSGEFILPNNGLTGQYYLEIRGISGRFRETHYFSVEEYKRPKFETSFEPVRETFRVNDSVTVQGTANAYAGSAITDAKVSYRVKRVVNFPRWYYWHHPYYNTAPQEIAHGETVTDASGRFEIDFKALPDTSASEENLPVFRFEVTADVTDINGETRSATTTVSVGYHALTADIDIPDRLNKDGGQDSLGITTENLNGQSVAAQGTLKMYKLQAPEQVLRPRPWEAPDYQNWNKDVFKEKFPHDAFTNEDDPATWAKGKPVWETDFNKSAVNKVKPSDNDTSSKVESSESVATTFIQLPDLEKWSSGKYVVELETQDKFGQPVKEAAHTTLFSKKDKKLADNQLFQIRANQESYVSGEKVELTVSSAAKNLFVSVSVEKNRKIVDRRVIKLNNNSKTFSTPVTSEDVGGFAVNYHFSAYNSFQSGSMPIMVPYPKTDLEIETLTFRDKLRPDSDETWSFKIKGAKGNQVGAELLASMYDASLDAFLPHSWNFNPLMRSPYYATIYTDAGQSFGVNQFRSYLDFEPYDFTAQTYDRLDWFGLSFDNSRFQLKRMTRGRPAPVTAAAMAAESEDAVLNEVVITGEGEAEYSKTEGATRTASEKELDKTQEEQDASMENVPIRKNLQETAFFFPHLMTDKGGNVSFNFTTPEALTRWKVQLLAHTKNLESAGTTTEAVTQKELMVIPNTPRFLREGDEIAISTKIANLTDKALSGQAILELTDAVSGKDISAELIVVSSNDETSGGEHSKKKNGGQDPDASDNRRNFKVDSLNNTEVSWRLKIPKRLQAVQYKVIAKAGDFSDGEQNLLPVLTNSQLVTETLPMWVRSNQTKTFRLDKLKENTSTTLSNHQLTLEITSNPAWYAVQALPYLMEYPHECNEQTFARYYANSLASHIANSNPRIREVFDQWANSDALISDLEKNEELKSILIQETPWLRDAQSETEQKKRIALLFNLDKMRAEQASALSKLKNKQKSSGAWAWFTGGPDNRFITQHIVTGLGHLKHLEVKTDPSKTSENSSSRAPEIKSLDAPGSGSDADAGSGSGSARNQMEPTRMLIQKAIAYLDAEFVREYEEMKKYASDLDENHLSPIQIHYFYMRSFFPDIETSQQVDTIISYYQKQARKYWAETELSSKGMLALVMHRANDITTAKKILESLKENSITSDELGMYWKENTASWRWNQAPLETQALMIEAFGEIDPAGDRGNTQTIDNLKIWLLKNKQTNQWKTTKATTEAIYALLLRGSDWLSITDAVDVLVGGEKIEPIRSNSTTEKNDSRKGGITNENTSIEAGTGYYKTSWNSNQIRPEMAEVQLTKKGEGITWGALYWQYFENLDKITSAETPLKLKKNLFLKKNTDTGEEISEITPETELKVGDLVRVRIELHSDRDIEFLHMKDMRAAGFESINVLSSYKWQDGLGYYESTKDASTNFFFDYLPKGVYIFEYDLRVNNVGDFSNGITTIQSMYAPEFSSHSEGIRVTVDD